MHVSAQFGQESHKQATGFSAEPFVSLVLVASCPAATARAHVGVEQKCAVQTHPPRNAAAPRKEKLWIATYSPVAKYGWERMRARPVAKYVLAWSGGFMAHSIKNLHGTPRRDCWPPRQHSLQVG